MCVIKSWSKLKILPKIRCSRTYRVSDNPRLICKLVKWLSLEGVTILALTQMSKVSKYKAHFNSLIRELSSHTKIVTFVASELVCSEKQFWRIFWALSCNTETFNVSLFCPPFKRLDLGNALLNSKLKRIIIGFLSRSPDRYVLIKSIIQTLGKSEALRLNLEKIKFDRILSGDKQVSNLLFSNGFKNSIH